MCNMSTRQADVARDKGAEDVAAVLMADAVAGAAAMHAADLANVVLSCALWRFVFNSLRRPCTHWSLVRAIFGRAWLLRSGD